MAATTTTEQLLNGTIISLADAIEAAKKLADQRDAAQNEVKNLRLRVAILGNELLNAKMRLKIAGLE